MLQFQVSSPAPAPAPTPCAAVASAAAGQQQQDDADEWQPSDSWASMMVDQAPAPTPVPAPAAVHVAESGGSMSAEQAEQLARVHLLDAQKIARQLKMEQAAAERMMAAGMDATALTDKIAEHKAQALAGIYLGLDILPNHKELSALLLELGGKPRPASTSRATAVGESAGKAPPREKQPRLELLQELPPPTVTGTTSFSLGFTAGPVWEHPSFADGESSCSAYTVLVDDLFECKSCLAVTCGGMHHY